MEYYYYETTYSSTTSSSSVNSVSNDEEVAAAEREIEKMAAESAVVIFSVSSCCMCHAIKRLLCGMGVNPTVHELDLLPHGPLLLSAAASSAAASLPLVFVGGKLLGAMDALMASHINGTLVPLLKDAGALWL